MNRSLFVALALIAQASVHANAQTTVGNTGSLVPPVIDPQVIAALFDPVFRVQEIVDLTEDASLPREGWRPDDSTAPRPVVRVPAIPGYGHAIPLPGAAVQPDTGTHYKIVVDVTTAAATPDQPVPGLSQIAKLINLYTQAGVPRNHLTIVAVVHGAAVTAVLDSAHYHAVADRTNPNLNLIHQLQGAGVTLYVCGQSLVTQKYDATWVAPGVVTALSALTVLPTYQLNGYALLPY